MRVSLRIAINVGQGVHAFFLLCSASLCRYTALHEPKACSPISPCVFFIFFALVRQCFHAVHASVCVRVS